MGAADVSCNIWLYQMHQHIPHRFVYAISAPSTIILSASTGSTRGRQARVNPNLSHSPPYSFLSPGIQVEPLGNLYLISSLNSASFLRASSSMLWPMTKGNKLVQYIFNDKRWGAQQFGKACWRLMRNGIPLCNVLSNILAYDLFRRRKQVPMPFSSSLGLFHIYPGSLLS
jgi:hypothetical protein